MSAITKENIEKLGFRFSIKDEETNSDYTFDKKSKRRGWMDLLVWHPETNNIIVTQYSPKLKEVVARGTMYPDTKITDYIIQKFEGNFINMSQLVSRLKESNII